ncbi:MAG: methylmalonyl-CoA mutase [Elusimicrobia bacterium]|nr:methylmalonyl-CoA mutase [Elusimicrobiota bacterium]
MAENETETAAPETEFLTPSGIPVQRFYGPGAPGAAGRDTRDPSFYAKLGVAGEPPFTRGVQRTMYRGRLWTMRQYAGFGTASQTNERFRYLLAQGQTGLSTAFDLPTQTGYDADAPEAGGEVGRVGVHVGTLTDMETLLEGIPLGEVSTSLTINATAPILQAFYVAVAKKQGVDAARIRGTLQNDILKEYLARGTYIYPVEHGMRLAVDAIEHSVRHFPKWNPISISGYHIREAGSDAVQEVAFTLANAEAYVDALLSRGLAVDDFAPRLAFFFGCHSHFLEEVAKFRAARRIWSRLMTERYKAKDPRSAALRFHVQTCGSTLTSRQPLNNVARVSLQAMAAVLGGCQSLHTNAYDEALALPTEESARLALRTQQILACETGAAGTVDPVAGSYAIEALTDELEAKVVALMDRVREGGGMLPAIAAGRAQAEIQESAFKWQKDVESGRRKVVGVNCYEIDEKGKTARPTLKVSPKLEVEQKKRLAAFKRKRPTATAAAAVAELSRKAGDPKVNLFLQVLACVENGATLGEICAALRGVFGEHHGR